MSKSPWICGLALSVGLAATASAQTMLVVTPRGPYIEEEEEPLLGIPESPHRNIPEMQLVSGVAPQPLNLAVARKSPSGVASQPAADRLRELADDVERMGLTEETAELRNLATRIEKLTAERLETRQQRLRELEEELRTVRRELASLQGVQTLSQVQVQLHLLEISADELGKLPIEWRNPRAGQPAGSPNQRPETSVAQAQVAARTRPESGGNGLASREVIEHEIKSLVAAQRAKIVAAPTLVTREGRPATFHSGGQFPILVPQSNNQKTIQFRDFGVRLEVAPQLVGDRQWQLDVECEHSQRDFSNSVTVGEMTVPGLTSRSINARVEIPEEKAWIISLPMVKEWTPTGDAADKPAGDSDEPAMCQLTVITVKPVHTTTGLNPIPTY